jgi:hypothetical protein
MATGSASQYTLTTLGIPEAAHNAHPNSASGELMAQRLTSLLRALPRPRADRTPAVPPAAPAVIAEPNLGRARVKRLVTPPRIG